jgi:hypothetical protein
MSKTKGWFMEEEAKRYEQLEAGRAIIEHLKADIKQHISEFDYDSLQEIETLLRSEKSTRPEELYY